MAKSIGIVLGLVFLVVGILGFFPNPIVGMDALFHTNTAHNWVHIISGLLFIIVALAARNAVGMVLKVFAVVYLLVAIIGFAAGADAEGVRHVLGFIHVNAADNWLHLVLAIVIWIAGTLAGKNHDEAPVAPTQTTG